MDVRRTLVAAIRQNGARVAAIRSRGAGPDKPGSEAGRPPRTAVHLQKVHSSVRLAASSAEHARLRSPVARRAGQVTGWVPLEGDVGNTERQASVTMVRSRDFACSWLIYEAR